MEERGQNAGMVSELEKSAMRGDPMPDGLCLPDQALYQALRELYRCYRAKSITREDAKKEKSALLKSHAKLMQWHRIYQETADMRNRLADSLARANKEGCECCQTVVRIFDGRSKL